MSALAPPAGQSKGPAQRVADGAMRASSGGRLAPARLLPTDAAASRTTAAEAEGGAGSECDISLGCEWHASRKLHHANTLGKLERPKRSTRGESGAGGLATIREAYHFVHSLRPA